MLRNNFPKRLPLPHGNDGNPDPGLEHAGLQVPDLVDRFVREKPRRSAAQSEKIVPGLRDDNGQGQLFIQVTKDTLAHVEEPLQNDEHIMGFALQLRETGCLCCKRKFQPSKPLLRRLLVV